MVKLKAGSRPPWVGLAAAVWVQVAAGNPFNFPLYSPTLKSVLGYSQQQLTLLGVANDIGENVGILPGIVCNKLPPWVVLMIGALFCFLGYGVIWLAVTQTVTSLPFIVVIFVFGFFLFTDRVLQSGEASSFLGVSLGQSHLATDVGKVYVKPGIVNFLVIVCFGLAIH